MQKYLTSKIIDIEYLLCLTTGKSKTWLWTNKDYKLTSAEIEKLENLIKKRENGVPFAYLSGEKSFYHLDFIVNENTLIPRPETENIIEIVKNLNLTNAKVLDLGTGSGIIAITLKDLFPNFEILAVDNNTQTLEVAKLNAKKHNTNINFVLSSWFENIVDFDFDLIISNPPYIQEDDKHLQDLSDPIGSLTSPENGLKDIKEIIKNSPKYLKKDGFLLLEHGHNQQKEIVNLLTDFKNIKTFDDLNNVNRNILAQVI
jgi:release factor glutamine methyltransferase